MDTNDPKAAMRIVVEAFNEVHDLWHEAEQAYHDPRVFRREVNALIQAARNLTFRLQSQKGSIPGFDEWYAPWQSAFAGDEVMRWTSTSRIQVVHQSGLRPASTATLEVISSYNDAFRHTATLDPQLPTVALVEGFVKSVGELPPNSLVSVERRWSTDELGERELLGVLALAIRALEFLMLDLAKKLAGDPVDDPQALLRNRKARDCMELTAERRTIRVNPNTGARYAPETKSVAYDPEVGQHAAERYGLTEAPTSAPDSLVELGLWFLGIAKRILAKDGNHVSLLVMILPDGSSVPVVLEPEDRLDKYLLWHQMADRVAEAGAVAFVFVGEVWHAPATASNVRLNYERGLEGAKGRREALLVHAEDSTGNGRVWTTMFKRRLGKIRLQRTVESAVGDLGFAEPIRRVWRSKADNGEPKSD